MSNYILADLRRILTRIPYLTVSAVLYAILILTVVVTHNGEWNSVTFITSVRAFFQFMVSVMGLVILIAVFADDFKAKTMQVAIGIGISRAWVVLGKLLEIMILTGLNLLLMSALTFALGGMLHAGLAAEQVGEIFGILVVVWLNIVSYSSIIMILLFYTQSVGVWGLLYPLLSIGLVSFGIDRIFEIPALSSSNMNMLTLKNTLNIFESHLAVGDFKPELLLRTILYIAIGYILSVLLFKNRELEF